jgi:transposase
MKGFRSHPSSFPGLCPDASWAHARRNFFELADIATKARNRSHITISPIAFEAVQKIDAIFAAERAINGLDANLRLRYAKLKFNTSNLEVFEVAS